jgi:hypothetical protein
MDYPSAQRLQETIAGAFPVSTGFFFIRKQEEGEFPCIFFAGTSLPCFEGASVFQFFILKTA